MRMSVGTRILFTLFLLVIIAVCVGIVLVSLGVVSEYDVQALVNGLLNTNFKYIWLGAALIMAVIAISLMFFGVGSRDVAPRVVTLETTSAGRVDVTTDALRELADNYLKTISGINIMQIGIRPLGFRSMQVDLRIAVRKEVEIPSVTEKISEEIKEYFETYAGINADHVVINVMPMQTPQY